MGRYCSEHDVLCIVSLYKRLTLFQVFQVGQVFEVFEFVEVVEGKEYGYCSVANLWKWS